MIRSHRRVSAAVDVVFDIAAATTEFDLEDIVAAVAEERGRSIEVEMAALPPGVCGQRRAYPDHDVIVLAPDLPNYERTLAHELGHIVFRHEGTPVERSLHVVSEELIAFMLSERSLASTVVDGADELAEWEAETFAGQLLQRLRRMNTRGTPLSVLRFDQALG
ncbi:ImmA/IrrE family metallo-endopeptidase [Rhodococcus sp. 06-462-5]|uniref:ImmA/IrrE family metallo-endopeptidase n=1 Tax=Nocardiaceae TaxID=85025 RepID=UPI00050C5D11|nr:MULTISPECIES: ImmA/IrrE family metallo-endopeptidase [Rhodococcus]OZC74048.1 ImmA/IrrE family metallo-endopeptidase [Rhodococcus sp. 06-462-5]OZE68044.1 ImmA/IrrE family metallo-endopeptidase [Rhodococcus sp. 02-925g]